MIFKKIGVFLSSLLITACDEGTLADYFVYTEITKDQPGVRAVPKNTFTSDYGIADNFQIKDPKNVSKIPAQINFNGLSSNFPPDLEFELYLNDKKLSFPDTIDYTVTTVLGNSVRYYKQKHTSLKVDEVIENVKKQNNIPDSITYFSIAGIINNIDVGNPVNPGKITLRLKTIVHGTVISDTKRSYELTQPKLYKVRSRPFG